MKVSYLAAGTYSRPDTWPDATTGGVVDGTGFGVVNIWVDTAPSAAWTFQTSPDGVNNWATITALGLDFSQSTTTGTTAGARFSVPGGGFIRLNGGTGGTFIISGQ